MPSCFALYLFIFFLVGGKLHMHLMGFEPTTSTTLLLKEVLLKFAISRTMVSGPAGIFFQEIMGRGWVKGSNLKRMHELYWAIKKLKLLSLWPSRYCLMCGQGHVEHEDLSFSSDIHKVFWSIACGIWLPIAIILVFLMIFESGSVYFWGVVFVCRFAKGS